MPQGPQNAGTLFLLVVGLAACGQIKDNNPPTEGPSAALQARIESVENHLGGWVRIEGEPNWSIRDRMAYYHVAGLSVAVVNDYRIEWAKGYGVADVTDGRAVSPTTLFQAASVGKSMHAAGVLRLAQEGKIDLDEDVNQYLERWKFPYDSLSGGKRITSRAILSHTAGLSVHGFDGYKWDHPLPDIVQILDGLPPANSPPVRSLFEPGLRFQYSGGGYTISGLMVEDLTGQTYADYMKTAIFEPLHMDHTFYQSNLPAGSGNDLASGYRFDGADIGCKYHIYAEEACGAALWSTPTDIAKFIVELQLSLEGKPNRILSTEMARRMMTPQVEEHNALGVFVERRGDKEYFHHSGENEGFTSDYYASLTGGKGVVIMANTDYANLIDITEEIVNSVATAYGWEGFYSPVVKKEVAVADTVLDDYLGRYKFRDDLDQTVTVYRENGTVWFHDSASPVPWRMHFSSPADFFFHEVFFNNHVFTRDSSGRVDGFLIQAPDGEFKVKRVEAVGEKR